MKKRGERELTGGEWPPARRVSTTLRTEAGCEREQRRDCGVFPFPRAWFGRVYFHAE
jgi:hypothetical protein